MQKNLNKCLVSSRAMEKLSSRIVKLSSRIVKLSSRGLTAGSTYLIKLFLILCCSWLISSPAFAVNQGDPVALLQSVADRMVAALKANKATIKTNPQLVYQLANKIIVPYADLSEMSKRVLPPQAWAQATAAQRAQFEREFTMVLIRTYASALAAYQNQQVKIYPVRGGYANQTMVDVDSDIVDGSSIHVVYRMMRRGSQWRLYDMSVEGVSMLENFRSQFSDALSQGNMDELIKRLAAHNTRRGKPAS